MSSPLKPPSALLLFGLLLPSLAFPASVPLIHGEASILLEEGRFLEALTAYEQLTDEAFPIQWQASAHLKMGGILLLFLDDYENGEAHLKKAVALDPDGPLGARAFFKLGMLYHEQQRYGEAAVAFERSIELEPGGVNTPTAEFLRDQCRRLSRLPAPLVEPEAVERNELPVRSTLVRVAVAKGHARLRLSCQGMWAAAKDGSRKAQELQAGTVTVDGASSCIQIDGKATDASELEFRPLGDARLSFDGVSFPGRLRILHSRGNLLVINVVDLEQYLRGVVPKEMPASWPEEALAAQAICARTYAMYQKARRTDYQYDLLSTVSSQVYGGADAWHSRTDEAVRKTKGRVLLYQGALALTLFHSSSGGHTEDMENVWGAGLPYLKGRKDPYSPSKPWEYSIRLKELESILRKRGATVEKLKRVVFLDKGVSGRFKTVRVEGRQGTTDLRGDRFRGFVGPGKMKSTKVRPTMSRSGLQLEGVGFGHGVGLSQWGARAMAQQGSFAEEIVAFYYPETRLGVLVNVE